MYKETDFRGQTYLVAEKKRCDCRTYQVPFGDMQVTVHNSVCREEMIAFLASPVGTADRKIKADVNAWVKKELHLEQRPHWLTREKVDSCAVPNLRLDHRQEVVGESEVDDGVKVITLTLCGEEAQIIYGDNILSAATQGAIPDGFKDAAKSWIRKELAVSSKALASLKVQSIAEEEAREKNLKRERIESIIKMLAEPQGKMLRELMEQDLEQAYAVASELILVDLVLSGGKASGLTVLEFGPQGIRQL